MTNSLLEPASIPESCISPAKKHIFSSMGLLQSELTADIPYLYVTNDNLWTEMGIIVGMGSDKNLASPINSILLLVLIGFSSAPL